MAVYGTKSRYLNIRGVKHVDGVGNSDKYDERVFTPKAVWLN